MYLGVCGLLQSLQWCSSAKVRFSPVASQSGPVSTKFFQWCSSVPCKYSLVRPVVSQCTLGQPLAFQFHSSANRTSQCTLAQGKGCVGFATEGAHHQLRQLDSIHNSGLRLALGTFCTSPVSSLYTEANEAPLEERRLKLSMHYYVKTRACIDNPAHHALHEFDRTTKDLYAPRPNGRGGMTRPPAPPIGLKVEGPWPLQRSMPNWSAPEDPTFHQERTTMIPRDTTSLKE